MAIIAVALVPLHARATRAKRPAPPLRECYPFRAPRSAFVMIRPLRICHRRIFTVLGILLPVAFGLGIAARKPVPVVTFLPAELNVTARAYAPADWEQTDIFTNAPVYVHTLRAAVPGRRRAIAFTAEPGFVKPDLLVYWRPGKLETLDKLPENAVLLGSFNSPELLLPGEATGMEGSIILYSLADGELVAVSRPTRFAAATK